MLPNFSEQFGEEIALSEERNYRLNCQRIHVESPEIKGFLKLNYNVQWYPYIFLMHDNSARMHGLLCKNFKVRVNAVRLFWMVRTINRYFVLTTSSICDTQLYAGTAMCSAPINELQVQLIFHTVPLMHLKVLSSYYYCPRKLFLV